MGKIKLNFNFDDGFNDSRSLGRIFLTVTISLAFVRIDQLWPRWYAVMRCETPFVIFFTGHVRYFLQQRMKLPQNRKKESRGCNFGKKL